MLDRLAERVNLPYNAEAIVRGGSSLAEYIRQLISVLQNTGHYEERRALNWILSVQNSGVVYFSSPDSNGSYPVNTMRLYYTGGVLYLQKYNGSVWSNVSSTTLGGLFTVGDIAITDPDEIYALSHNEFTDVSEDEHVPHSGVSVTAGSGLSGGGTIESSVTLANSDRGSTAVSIHETAYDHDVLSTDGVFYLSKPIDGDYAEGTWRINIDSGVAHLERKDSGVWTSYQQWG
jgi:hypothetical protein